MLVIACCGVQKRLQTCIQFRLRVSLPLLRQEEFRIINQAGKVVSLLSVVHQYLPGTFP